MPPKPIAAPTNPVHSGPLRRAPSSRRTLVSSSPAPAGISRHSARSVTSPSAPTTTNAARQPSCCPANVERGTPTTFAIVRPAIIVATARPRRPGPATAAPTAAPTPKNAPCGSPARKRPATRVSMLPAVAEKRFPSV
ncbi:Uncharacterised protein [Mycobacteroides abscessus]|nr:Uncharacterised protein [Mycobacteroides abscessus]